MLLRDFEVTGASASQSVALFCGRESSSSGGRRASEAGGSGTLHLLLHLSHTQTHTNTYKYTETHSVAHTYTHTHTHTHLLSPTHIRTERQCGLASSDLCHDGK